MIKNLILWFLFVAIPVCSNAQDTNNSGIKVFDDWVAGCDVGKYISCTAVALNNRNLEYKKQTVMRITRYSEGLTRIKFLKINPQNRIIKVKVEGKLVSEFFPDRDFSYSALSNSITIWDDKINKLISPIARGKYLTIEDDNGKLLGTISLKGSFFALKSLDIKQKFDGYDSAFVLIGNKVKKKRGFPTMVAPGPIKAVNLSLEDILSNNAYNISCGQEQFIKNSEIHAIINNSRYKGVLLLIECGENSLNRRFKAYIGLKTEDSEWQFDSAKFKKGQNLIELPTLINANALVDDFSVIVESREIKRVENDCGKSVRYIWKQENSIENSFFEVSTRFEMPICGGDTEWIRVE